MEYVNITYDYDKKMYEKTLFNGNIISDVTDLKGKDLGVFMASIKDKVDIHGNVRKQILDLFNNYKGG